MKSNVSAQPTGAQAGGIRPATKEEFAQAAAEVDEALHEAEEALRAMGFGVGANVEIQSVEAEPDFGIFHITYLAFGKRQGRWQLHLASRLTDDDNWDEIDLWTASLERRTQALRALPALYEELCNRRNQRVQDLRDAARVGRDFIEHTLKAGASDE